MTLRDRVRVWWFFRWIHLHYWRGVWRHWYWRSMTLEEAREVAAQELLLELTRVGIGPWSRAPKAKEGSDG